MHAAKILHDEEAIDYDAEVTAELVNGLAGLKADLYNPVMTRFDESADWTLIKFTAEDDSGERAAYILVVKGDEDALLFNG